MEQHLTTQSGAFLHLDRDRDSKMHIYLCMQFNGSIQCTYVYMHVCIYEYIHIFIIYTLNILYVCRFASILHPTISQRIKKSAAVFTSFVNTMVPKSNLFLGPFRAFWGLLGPFGAPSGPRLRGSSCRMKMATIAILPSMAQSSKRIK